MSAICSDAPKVVIPPPECVVTANGFDRTFPCQLILTDGGPYCTARRSVVRLEWMGGSVGTGAPVQLAPPGGTTKEDRWLCVCALAVAAAGYELVTVKTDEKRKRGTAAGNAALVVRDGAARALVRLDSGGIVCPRCAGPCKGDRCGECGIDVQRVMPRRAVLVGANWRLVDFPIRRRREMKECGCVEPKEKAYA
jgi:hypothetical protein